ncbi:hypothetical protein JDV02_008435 [Purpureocillium takamizusanense]|uniref:Uncharacterized protein n=1 Tax=Purpureocillium takamizusanense TaxID=2060973 RepID=A0A9Q8QNT7_9HYPO|nr:uncharacterized protein JDV02_008435 [Purpureocillium takamizusanense]UNI22556.1 hypothetical protein JDV02_008435 [Purpureocillium takamizusanense]
MIDEQSSGHPKDNCRRKKHQTHLTNSITPITSVSDGSGSFISEFPTRSITITSTTIISPHHVPRSRRPRALPLPAPRVPALCRMHLAGRRPRALLHDARLPEALPPLDAGDPRR